MTTTVAEVELIDAWDLDSFTPALIRIPADQRLRELDRSRWRSVVVRSQRYEEFLAAYIKRLAERLADVGVEVRFLPDAEQRIEIRWHVGQSAPTVTVYGEVDLREQYPVLTWCRERVQHAGHAGMFRVKRRRDLVPGQIVTAEWNADDLRKRTR